MLASSGIFALSFVTAVWSASLPLPTRLDIPADFSTVICPNEAQAHNFFNNNLVEGANGIDISVFFSGLRATGCQQRSGPLQIEAVLGRKTIQSGPTTYMLYRARGPSGAVVFGVSDENGNNRHARTPYQAWINNYTQNGYVSDETAEKRMHQCRTPQSARNVIAAIPAHRNVPRHGARQIQAKNRALTANACVMARGRFRVDQIHNKVSIITGFEAGEEWIALTATDSQGKVVGLLYDISPY